MCVCVNLQDPRSAALACTFSIRSDINVYEHVGGSVCVGLCVLMWVGRVKVCERVRWRVFCVAVFAGYGHEMSKRDCVTVKISRRTAVSFYVPRCVSVSVLGLSEIVCLCVCVWVWAGGRTGAPLAGVPKSRVKYLAGIVLCQQLLAVTMCGEGSVCTLNLNSDQA